MYEEEFLVEMIFNDAFRQDIYRLEQYDKLYKRQKLYRQKNKERIKLYSQTPKAKDCHRKSYTKYYLSRRENDINFKILTNLRNRIHISLKRNSKSAHTEELIGCSIEFLKKHLESQFVTGMTWENYGKWHIDHIRPCASFDLSKTEEQCKCFNYNNLQPLWALDNILKSDS